MTRIPKRGRVDANQAELVKLWRSLGGSWQSTADIPGALDGIAGMYGQDVRVEIKDGSKPPSKRKLTDKEREVFSAWKGRKPEIWERGDDVINMADTMRRALMRYLY